jgi:ABC-type phosphate transport system permease subunit
VSLVVTAEPDETWADEESAEDTWTDNSPARARRDIDVRAQQRHENRMQSRALFGVGVLFLITLVVVIVAPWVAAISEDFARTLAQMILPALLASGATIIGTLFKLK